MELRGDRRPNSRHLKTTVAEAIHLGHRGGLIVRTKDIASRRRSDNITCFKTHRETGQLSFTGAYTPAGTPSIVALLS
jgi:6-phosphogluconolactonase (cycloisomerase 2 family)